MAKTFLSLTQVKFNSLLTTHLYILTISLRCLQLLQIQLLFTNSAMIIIVDAILMRTFCLFKPWPRGKCFTRAGLNRVYTLSTLVKLILCLYLLQSAIMLLPHLQLGNYGITGLVIHMPKSCKHFFLCLRFLPISVIVYLVRIVLVVKFINFPFLLPNLLHIHHWNWYTLMYGALVLFFLLINSGIMCCLQIIILCFTWIYFLKHMFFKFKSMAETQFSSKLKILRLDGGGEYVSKEFESYLSVCGILHQLSYPYTPQQNGLVEQKHRHIIETTITLLSKASLPFQYQSYATQIAVFLTKFASYCHSSLLLTILPIISLST